MNLLTTSSKIFHKIRILNGNWIISSKILHKGLTTKQIDKLHEIIVVWSCNWVTYYYMREEKYYIVSWFVLSIFLRKQSILFTRSCICRLSYLLYINSSKFILKLNEHKLERLINKNGIGISRHQMCHVLKCIESIL